MSVISGETKKISELTEAQDLVNEDLLVVERASGGTQKMQYGTMVEKTAEGVMESQAMQDLVGKVNNHDTQIQSLSTTQSQQAESITSLGEKQAAQEETLGAHTQSINQLSSGKQDKATDPDELGEGYLYQDEEGNVILAAGSKPGKSFKYTIVFDNGSDGTPGAVTYADDAVGMTPASGSNLNSWETFVNTYFKPCVIKPGSDEPEYFLNPTNLKQKLDGTTAVLTGADGDVMIQVGKLYGKFSNNGTTVTASISNVKEDDTWFCWNDIAGVERDYTYKGRYMAGVASGAGTVMRSISGVAKLVNITRANGRQYAKNRGDKYHQNNIYLGFLWEFMFLLLYKNRNTQTTLGQGRTNSSNTSSVANGWSDNYGCCWGDQGGVNGVVFLWVEDWFGDCWEWMDGACVVSDVYKLTRDPSKYNDTGDGYEISVASGMTANANNNNYITKVTGTNAIPFLPAGSGGSDSTFFCDNMWLADGTQVVRFGGSWYRAAWAGGFCWSLSDAASAWASRISSRLCRF